LIQSAICFTSASGTCGIGGIDEVITRATPGDKLELILRLQR
jgi:hypothetical protein